MTAEPVELDTLLAVREQMVRELQNILTAEEREFLLSVASAEPRWDLSGIPHLDQLPAVRWKMQNRDQLRKADARKFAEQSDALVRLLLPIRVPNPVESGRPEGVRAA